VSRTTVTKAYESLVDERVLVARERSGYYVSANMFPHITTRSKAEADKAARVNDRSIRWQEKFACRPLLQNNISKPKNWYEYRYPFIYGQPEPSIFPINEWRRCCSDVHTKNHSVRWMLDSVEDDCPGLIHYLLKDLLPRRGIYASDQEIVLTLGAQHALFLIAGLFLNENTAIGMEEPGYVDARNIFSLSNARVVPLTIDRYGLEVTDEIRQCDYLYVTPSHQSPTTAIMPEARRRLLLEAAHDSDIIIIEDDYDSEINFVKAPLPALKNYANERVLYVGSLSKTLSPSVRVGYVVAPEACIRELKALRRLMVRHLPKSVLFAVSSFVQREHYDAYLCRLHKHLQEKWECMFFNLNKYLPGSLIQKPQGGVSFWLKTTSRLDALTLQQEAAKQGILIEPGQMFYMNPNPPLTYFRLGFGAIGLDRIPEGIGKLASIMNRF
jgi:GntR family transcriptional regulator/MocR family aminotransferase